MLNPPTTDDIERETAGMPKTVDSESTLNAVMTAFDGFAYTCSRDYRVLFHNEAMKRRIGHDAVGEFCYHALHERDSVCPWCVNEAVFAGETVRSVAQSPKDNRWFEVCSSPIRKGGTVIAKLGMFVDITDRKEAEEALRQSEARYRLLFDNSMDAVFLSPEDGRISAANSAACTLFGMTEEELCVAGRAGIMDSTDARLSEALQRRAQTGKVRGELRYKRHDGSTFPGEVTSVILDDAQIHSFHIVRDITERKRAEEEIIALNATLDQRVRERTEELESAIREQESFSYSVSHDLRAPLRHINSYSAIVAEEFSAEIPEGARAYLERIREATSKMGILIDSLLGLSRVARTEMTRESVDLTDLATSIVAQYREVEPGRSIELIVEEGLRVQGDRALLRQMLENLLGNAWKYSATKESARIEVGNSMVANGPAYFVKDNGAGFDMAYSEKLFSIFQRIHGSEFEGTGIGLATAHKIIKRHGGSIWAESKVNEGATFYFTIP